MNINVCYTCIFGDYDILNDPKYISNNFDYICFTNNKNLKSNIWKIIYIDKKFNDKISQIKFQRYLKLHPHKILFNYEFSIYVDGNVIIQNDLNYVKNNICSKNVPLYFKPHPNRNCTYLEYFGCLYWKKDKLEIMSKQMLKYYSENFPSNYGLSETNILCRYHNNENCVKLMEYWWNEIFNHSHRDQLSLFYSIWKLNMKNNIYIYNNDEMIYIRTCFLCNYHHSS